RLSLPSRPGYSSNGRYRRKTSKNTIQVIDRIAEAYAVPRAIWTPDVQPRATIKPFVLETSHCWLTLESSRDCSLSDGSSITWKILRESFVLSREDCQGTKRQRV